MIAWLKDARRARPKRLDKGPASADKGVDVTPTFKSGTITLQRGDHVVTLHWTKSESDRRRRLPAGDYLVRTTRLEAEKGGAWWFISSTGPAKRKIRIAKGSKLSIAGEVQFKGIARRRGDKLQLGFTIKSKDGRGLSIYRDGKRLPVRYKLFDRKGSVIARGTMNYG